MTGRRLRIAIAGAGGIGRQHIERILRSSECELAAIVDPAALFIDRLFYGTKVAAQLLFVFYLILSIRIFRRFQLS
jgi:hypothetical protein